MKKQIKYKTTSNKGYLRLEDIKFENDGDNIVICIPGRQKLKSRIKITCPYNAYKWGEHFAGFLKSELEKLIAKYAVSSYNYAKEILKGRFIEGEKAIATDPRYAYLYAIEILRGKFPEGEKAIAIDLHYSYWYARDILKGRFIEGEEAIAADPCQAYEYAKNILKGRFSKGEKAISTDPHYSYLYATEVLKAPFSAGEKAIRKNERLWKKYLEMFPDRRNKRRKKND